jgi:hypothetical protein
MMFAGFLNDNNRTARIEQSSVSGLEVMGLPVAGI